MFGYYLLTPEGKHQHTHYVCTSWPHPGDRCGWHGWTVPGWDAARPEDDPEPIVEAEPKKEGKVGIRFSAEGMGHSWSLWVDNVAVWTHSGTDGPWDPGAYEVISSLVRWGCPITVSDASRPEFDKVWPMPPLTKRDVEDFHAICGYVKREDRSPEMQEFIDAMGGEIVATNVSPEEALHLFMKRRIEQRDGVRPSPKSRSEFSESNVSVRFPVDLIDRVKTATKGRVTVSTCIRSIVEDAVSDYELHERHFSGR